MASSMDELVARFKTEARERSDHVQQLLAGMAGDAADAESCSAIREEAHKLKGAAGILGFPDLKDRAAELEDASAMLAGTTVAADAARRTLAPPAAALHKALPG